MCSGDQAASGSADGIIKLWNTKLGKQNYGTSYVKVATLVGHQKGVTSLGFSNNDSRLLSGSEDNTLRVNCKINFSFSLFLSFSFS
jgi:WD40 repeat protein